MIAELPDHLVRKIRPRRSVPGSAKALSRRAVASLRKKMAGRDAKGRLRVLEKGLGEGPDPELAPIHEAALALVRDLSAEAIQGAELDVLAAASLFTRRADGRVPIWASLVASRSLSDAVEVAATGLRFSLGAASAGWMTAVYLMNRTDARGWIDDGIALRHLVCSAPDEAYAEARDRALVLRPSLNLLDRAYLADLFPDEPWADEDLRALLDENNPHIRRYANLLSAAREPALVSALCAKSSHDVGELALDIVCGIEASAAIEILRGVLPAMLVKPQYGPLLKTPPRNIATALGLFRTREVAEILAPHLGSAILGPVVAAFFQDNPTLMDVLETHATGRGGRAAAERLRAQRSGNDADAGPEAADDDVPAILRMRPWRPRKKKDKPATTVLEGVTLPEDYEERVDLQGDPSPCPALSEAREMDAGEVETWREEVEAKKYACADYVYTRQRRSGSNYIRVPSDLGLSAWNEGRARYLSSSRVAWVRHHGLAALPGFIANVVLQSLDYEGADDYFDALASFVSPRMAPSIAMIAARRKKFRPRAERWLTRHADVAALGLIPPAVGATGPARLDAERALLFLARRGADAAVKKAAGEYGEDVAGVIAALLARDPLAIDVKPIKLPKFLRSADLPAVRLESGARLPAEARDGLIELLSIAPDGYPGIELLGEACDASSLAAFAAALLEQWVLGDAPGRHEWMLSAAVSFPSEAATRRLAALARDWARRKKVKARRACGALGALGTDLALLHLGHIAETSRFQDLRDDARAMLDDAARVRGLTRDELEDRSVPDLGLDPDGTLTLSFGGRTFAVTLNESLIVVVRDSDGNGLRGLPRTRKEDDVDAAKVARTRFKELQKDVASIATRQIRRLERAMVDGRWLEQGDFLALVARHPVLMHIARGLVWEAHAKSGDSRTFRVAEDGSLADLDDDETTLTEGESVRIAHPVRTRDLKTQWLRRFEEYELLQPFEQIGRATFAPTKTERAESACHRAEGRELAPEKLLGLLEARGYRRNDRGFPTLY
ncbi:MAG: hypothetical protein DRJ42_15740, partial [Deltaproteobacteria bacterium]